MRQSIAGAAVLGLVLTTGCAGLSDTEQRVLTGATGGAAGGALIGALAGDAALGAGIGAAAGLAGGYLWDRHKQSEERAYQQGVQAGRSGG
ncbi:MAG: glycine zipper domain-containing protein [Pseudomonadota bacterium]